MLAATMRRPRLGSLAAIPLSRLLSDAVGEAFLQVPLKETFAVDGVLLWLGVVVVLSSLASLAPARGALPGPHGGLFFGRLYGPALFPQALAQFRPADQLRQAIAKRLGVSTRHHEPGDAILDEKCQPAHL